MKLVIELTDEMYQAVKDGTWCVNELWYNALKNATPLEKVLEDIKAEITNERDSKGFCVWYYDDLMKKIDSHISGKEQK